MCPTRFLHLFALSEAIAVISGGAYTFVNDDCMGVLVQPQSQRSQLNSGAVLQSLDCRTIRLNCESDSYRYGNRFAGFILYGYYGEDTWVLQGKRCRSGYIVILNSDAEKVLSVSSTQGQVRALDAPVMHVVLAIASLIH
jgi:hypothetical protein